MRGTAATAAQVLCACRGLRAGFGRRPVLAGCDLEVRAGQIVGLTGENGSGKSTLVRCLLGFVRPRGGQVQCTRSVGYCPQENYLHRSCSIAEHLALVRLLSRTGAAPADPRWIDSVVDRLKLRPHLDTPMRRLSGGTYQKVKLLTAIVHRPDLLVLDEPTDGFDWTMYLVFWELMAELRARGAGVLMISHLLHDRERFDRIVDLTGGTLHG